MNMVREEGFGGYQPQHPWGEKPEGLPISTAVWEAAAPPNVVTSTFVLQALYHAITRLEAEVQLLRR